jgi:hypothetical protein
LAKNTKTYLLLAVVLLIWGIIGCKIYNALSPDTPEPRQFTAIKFNPQVKSEKDTFSISAGYRDPFLGTMPKKRITKVSKPKKKEVLKRAISFTGSIINKNANSSIFFVTIEGAQFLMKPGQSHKEVTLVNGTAKNIRVRYSGITETIPLQE